MSRHGKEVAEKRHKPSSFSLDDFVKAIFEEYSADPLNALLRVFKHVVDLSKARREAAESRARGSALIQTFVSMGLYKLRFLSNSLCLQIP